MNTIYIVGAILFASAVFMLLYVSWANYKALSQRLKQLGRKARFIRV